MALNISGRILTTGKISLTKFDGPASYWFVETTQALNSAGIAIGTDDNIYIGGTTTAFGQGSSDFVILKLDQNGDIILQKTLGGANIENTGAIALDSSNNIHIVGSTLSVGSNTGAYVAKFNSAGTLLWQRHIGTNAAVDRFEGVSLDSSGNVFAAGLTASQGAGGQDALLVKYDSSGAIQWQRAFGGASTEKFSAIVVDPSNGDIWGLGETTTGTQGGTGNPDMILIKFSTTGAGQTQRKLGGTGTEVFFGGRRDNDGNLYGAGWSNSSPASGFDAVIVKYTSGSALTWQRFLGGAGTDAFISCIVDSSGNVFCFGTSTSSGITGGQDLLLAKYNSGGTLQWQRFVGRSGISMSGPTATFAPNGDIFVTASGAGKNFLFKFPPDGPDLGTFSGLVIKNSALSAQTSTLTVTTPAMTTTTTTITTATPALTVGNPTFTNTKVSFS